MIAIACSGWAFACVVELSLKFFGDYVVMPTQALKHERSIVDIVLINAKYLILSFSVIIWGIILGNDLIFHEVPACQRFDSPLTLAFIYIFFELSMVINDPFLLLSNVSSLILGSTAVSISNTYVFKEMKFVDKYTRWANSVSYFNLFPPNESTSQSLSELVAYHSLSNFPSTFAHAFSVYNVNGHILRVILMSCVYALFSL